MTALLRLFVYALLLGAGLAAFRLALRPFLRILPLALYAARGKGAPIAKKAPRRGARVLVFFGDLFSVLFVFLVFIIFLYWQGDGIPRLFVFVAAALGAYIANRLLVRPAHRVEALVTAVLVRCIGWIFLPLRLFLAFFYRLLLKSAAHLIKTVKKSHTILKAHRYMRLTPKRIVGRCRVKAIKRAMKEGVSHVG